MMPPTSDALGTLYPPAFYREKRSGSRHAADAIVPIVAGLLQPRSVVDVGCGTADWLAAWQAHGVSDLLGIDGAHVQASDLAIPASQFLAADLAQFRGVGRSFDLALCLEVAEHLPRLCAEPLIDALTSLAPAVLFSAAVPGQRGVSHVNCQWPSYWMGLFRARGFHAYDVIRPHVWGSAMVPGWYQQNCFLYVDAAHPRLRVLASLRAPFDPAADLTLVSAATAWQAPATLRALPGIVTGAIVRSWRHWTGGHRRATNGRLPQPRRATERPRPASATEISVIVCTRNRERRLRACLEQLSRLESAGRWELVIVDNGSSDATPEILEAYRKTAAFPVTLVGEPRPGLGWARNAGIAAARGDILAFTDDDCYPAVDWLVHVARVFADPSVGYVGGRILLHDPADAAITIRTSTEPEWIPPRSFLRAGSIQGANMIVRRDVFDEVGRFDTLFGPGTPFIADDIELVGRASAAGWSGMYCPDAVVYHHHGRRLPAEVNRLKWLYARGRGAYFAKFLLQRHTRRLYAKEWLRSARAGGRREFATECAGAVHYWARRAGAVVRRRLAP